MIPSFVKTPVSLATHFTAGALRVGASGVRAVIGKAPPRATSVVVTPPTSMAPPAPVPHEERPTPSKPVATLDEPAAPLDDDPVVYSTGPDVATSLPAEDLKNIRSEL